MLIYRSLVGSRPRGRRLAGAGRRRRLALGVGGDDAVAVLERRRARRDDARAVVDAGDLDVLAVADADGDGHELRDQCRRLTGGRGRLGTIAARLLCHEDARLALQLDQRVARDRQRVGARVDRQVDAGIHAGLETVVDVRDLDLDLGGARRRVENRGDAADAALELLARVGVDFDVRGRARWHPAHVALDQVGDHAHGADVDHRRHRRVGAGERSRIEEALADEAIDRRDNLRVRQRDLELVEAGASGLELRPRQVELRQRRLVPRVDVVERLLRQQLALVEVARSVEVVLGQLQVGFALANRGLADAVGRFRLPHLLANLQVFDAGDDLALLDRVAELDIHGLQPAVDARHDVDGRGANQVADEEDLLADRRLLDVRELDGHRRPGHAAAAAGRTRSGARIGGVAAPVVEQETADTDDGDDDDRDCSSHGLKAAVGCPLPAVR